MNITIVLQQMIIIFFLIGLGFLLFHTKQLSETTSQQISGLIVNLTNPATLICSAFNDGPKVDYHTLITAFLVFIVIYIFLVIAGILIPLILKVPRKYHYSYKMLTVFGNVGFIGIPLASAVLGPESLIFVSINNLIFNMVIYTYGITLLEKAGQEQTGQKTDKSSFSLKKIINAGTISAVLTIVFYMIDLPIPVVLSTTLSYIGKSTTLLSMLVLGVSIAQMSVKTTFTNPKLYLFVLIRQILIPIACLFLLRNLISDRLLTDSAVLLLTVPAGNMSLMFSKQMELEADTISQGILLTTILCLITIPVVSLFY